MNRWRSDEGFTLTELLVAMVLTGLVGSGVLALVSASVRQEHVVRELGEEIESARTALDRLRKDIRSSNQIRVGSTDKMVILHLDANQNRSADPGELVTYQLVADGAGRANLVRWTDLQSAATAVVMARGLADVAMFSYDAPPDDTVLVTISLSAVSESGRVQNVLANATTVRVRNAAS